MSTLTQNDFRTYLRELVSRCKRNPQYSLRAFAKHLDMDASTLSKILSGKRSIGKKTVLQLGAKVGLTAKDLAKFTSPAQDAGDGSGNGRMLTFEAFQELALDQFAVISDWYHFAILELMTVEGFEPDRKWVAKALGLKTVEVDAAVDRLVRVGMLEVTRDGQWIDRSSGVTTNIGPDMKSSAHRRMQELFLEKAIAALSGVPIEERDHTAMTMSIDPDKLPEAREMIRKFRRSLAKLLNTSEKKTEVYNLNVALFPLTNLKRQKGERK